MGRADCSLSVSLAGCAEVDCGADAVDIVAQRGDDRRKRIYAAEVAPEGDGAVCSRDDPHFRDE